MLSRGFSKKIGDPLIGPGGCFEDRSSTMTEGPLQGKTSGGMEVTETSQAEIADI